MEPWRTAIASANDQEIRVRGYDITALMQRATFSDMVFLLHQGELPTPEKRKLLDSILISVADHGSGAPSCATSRLVASGNRQSLSAAIAAGVLAIGDEHGGAGSLCMEMIAAGIARAAKESLPLESIATQVVAEYRERGARIPGLGHRWHSIDPRTAILFNQARQFGLAGDGIRFISALETAVKEKIKPLPINVDGALAAVLHDLGFPPAAGKLISHHRTRRRPQCRSPRRIPARKGHAHSNPRRL